MLTQRRCLFLIFITALCGLSCSWAGDGKSGQRRELAARTCSCSGSPTPPALVSSTTSPVPFSFPARLSSSHVSLFLGPPRPDPLCSISPGYGLHCRRIPDAPGPAPPPPPSLSCSSAGAVPRATSPRAPSVCVFPRVTLLRRGSRKFLCTESRTREENSSSRGWWWAIGHLLCQSPGFSVRSLIPNEGRLLSVLACLGCRDKTPWTKWRKLQKFIPHSSEVWEVQAQVAGRFSFSRALFVASGWPPSLHVLTWPFLAVCTV